MVYEGSDPNDGNRQMVVLTRFWWFSKGSQDVKNWGKGPTVMTEKDD